MSVRVLLVGPRFQVDVVRRLVSCSGRDRGIVVDCLERSGLRSLLKYQFKYLTLKHYDVLHIIYPPHRLSYILAERGQRLGVRVILHWIGSDILLAKRRSLHASRVLKNSVNVAVAPWLKEELEELGVPVTDIVPLVPPELSQGVELLPLPEKFRVLYYLPSGREHIYHSEVPAEIAGEYPDIEVLVVGGGRLRGFRGNIVELGRLPRGEMRKVYRDTVVLVRYTEHDGMPLMVLEALAYGRYVIFNKPFDHVAYVEDKVELLEKIGELKEKFYEKKLTQNIEGSKYVLENYSPMKISGMLVDLWKNP